MNYLKIEHEDVCNGIGLRVVLWLSGCSHHCYNCQNPQTWNPDSGIQFDESAKQEIFTELSKDYISGITFSGGDPLYEYNLDEVLKLVQEIRISFPEKTIWLYTGFCWNDIMCSFAGLQADYVVLDKKDIEAWEKRREIISNVDVLVDGEYIDEQRDITLKWRGSSNQRVISVVDSLAQGKIVLYCD
jgi:anaerobic ribonucleoside-triphosphate reductase activating protein